MTRETWIAQAIDALRPDFTSVGAELPEKVRATIGFTSKGLRSSRIGECWYPSSVGDGVHELFVVPSITDGLRVLDILVHELVHVAAGPEAKHGPGFRKLATKLGLEGKMTATVAGPEMVERAKRILAEIGDYPHAGIAPQASLVSSGPKQGTRMLKVQCPVCEYTIRTTQKWLDIGLPVCPCGEEMAQV